MVLDLHNVRVMKRPCQIGLENNIDTQMFKYLQRFAFIEKDRYVFKAFEEENLIPDGWVTIMKTKLELLGLGNLKDNIFKVLRGEISKENYRSKHNFFQKRLRDCYIQNQFYNYVDNNENTSFFTKLKQTYEMERYLTLKNFEARKAISKLRLSSHKLAIVTGKWYRIEKESRLCNLCDQNSIEDEFHFSLNCDHYTELRKSLFQSIQETERIDLTNGIAIETLRELFYNGSLSSLHALGRFIQNSFELKEGAS